MNAPSIDLKTHMRNKVRDLLTQWWGTKEEAVEAVAKAIEDARGEERERIVRFVEDGANGWAGRDFRYQIADAIRES
jgi:pyruvate-formate lyase-activating enzyme